MQKTVQDKYPVFITNKLEEKKEKEEVLRFLKEIYKQDLPCELHIDADV